MNLSVYCAACAFNSRIDIMGMINRLACYIFFLLYSDCCSFSVAEKVLNPLTLLFRKSWTSVSCWRGGPGASKPFCTYFLILWSLLNLIWWTSCARVSLVERDLCVQGALMHIGLAPREHNLVHQIRVSPLLYRSRMWLRLHVLIQMQAAKRGRVSP